MSKRRNNKSIPLVTVECVEEGSVEVSAETFIEGLRRRIATNPEPIYVIADDLTYVHTLEAAARRLGEQQQT
jgi:hypothetical protein